MADIDEKLAEALRQARKTPMFFTFVAKGAGKLLVSKKKQTTQEVAGAKKAAGGGTVFRGRCVGEEGKLVFELAKEPPTTLNKQLKTIVTKAGLASLKVEARKAADLVEEVDDADATTGTTTSADDSAPPPFSDDAKPARDYKLQEQVTKRLSDMVGPYKEALEQKGPAVDQMQALYGQLKEALNAKDDVQASKILDQMEPLVVFLAKKSLTEKKIAGLEKLPQARHLSQAIAAAKTKVDEAVKLAVAPANDYKGAITALKAVDATLAKIPDMNKEYQRVLNSKADADKKIARVEKLPQANRHIAAEITDIKAKATAAVAKANPPGYDFAGAMNGLAEVEKLTAAAEVKMLDLMVSGFKNDKKLVKKYLEHAFKERFGVDLDLEDKGDNAAQVYEAMRRIYELMALVPESHTNRNPSLKEVERVGGPSAGKAFFQPGTHFLGITWAGDKINLKAGRPSNTHWEALDSGLKDSSGNFNPPIDPECQLKPGSNTQNFFDWSTLHEIGHAVDDRKGFMKSAANLALAGWIDHGKDCSAAAKAAAAHFHFQSEDALEYIKDLMEGKPGSRPRKKPKPPSGVQAAAWTTAMTNVENWVDSIRESADPWNRLPADIGGRVYHEAYKKQWVSYLRAARKQAVKGYQFRSHWEWFADLYAAYHTGVLKDEHPMVKKFLRDF